jgi:hypothetical protein
MALRNALTRHVRARGPVATWRAVARYKPEGLAVHTDVLLCTIALELAQSVDANPIMLAWVGSTFVNIDITPVSKKNPHYVYFYLQLQMCFNTLRPAASQPFAMLVFCNTWHPLLTYSMQQSPS